MNIEIKNCNECPFANRDNEFGNDSCNLAGFLNKEIILKEWDQLPTDKRHEDCPITEPITILV